MIHDSFPALLSRCTADRTQVCATDNMDLQCSAVNMDLLYIANSSYAVKTPKDEVTCDTYWNFHKKLKIWTYFPKNGRYRDQTGGRKTTCQNGSLPFKTGGWNICLVALFISPCSWCCASNDKLLFF